MYKFSIIYILNYDILSFVYAIKMHFYLKLNQSFGVFNFKFIQTENRQYMLPLAFASNTISGRFVVVALYFKNCTLQNSSLELRG